MFKVEVTSTWCKHSRAESAPILNYRDVISAYTQVQRKGPSEHRGALRVRRGPTGGSER
jgi:hypothetical protein